jgi:hypothetical protein
VPNREAIAEIVKQEEAAAKAEAALREVEGQTTSAEGA